MIGILWVMLGTFVMQPLDYDFSYSPVEESTTEQIQHLWYSSDDYRQAIVQRAYKLWWMDFVYMIECENWNWNINAVWDNGKAFWLCQMNTNYHKLPDEYKTNWVVQVEYCYNKWKQWVAFYGPTRIVKGQKCYNYVKSRFTLEQNNNG